MDKLNPEQRHKAMSRVKSKDTSIEVALRKALWREGVRYRKNCAALPGKPDIAVTKYRIAIFCDGELWHGKNWETRKETIKSNRDYWIPKIERNIKRDNEIDKKLEAMGWIVLRFWGDEIKKNAYACVMEVKETIYELQAKYGGGQRSRAEEWEDSGGSLAAEPNPEYGGSASGGAKCGGEKT